MGYYGDYNRYETVAIKKRKSAKKFKTLVKRFENLMPVMIEGSAISKKWWGKAWLKHLESYADYSNRLPRGKAYVRQGALFHLEVSKGKISAIVNGSGKNYYNVEIKVDTISKVQWAKLVGMCQNSIASLDALSEGKFSKDLEALLTDPKHGLFPNISEISFDCSCPDWAVMCKHIAAVLYGFGARLDDNPLLFFKLRDVNMEDLLKKTVEDKLESLLQNAGTLTDRTLPSSSVKDIFGIEINQGEI